MYEQHNKYDVFVYTQRFLISSKIIAKMASKVKLFDPKIDPWAFEGRLLGRFGSFGSVLAIRDCQIRLAKVKSDNLTSVSRRYHAH